MRIRVLTPSDAEVYQRLRLQGLQECPVAFGSSYVEEMDTPLETVARRLQSDDALDSWVLGAFTDEYQLIGVLGLHRYQRTKLHHKALIQGMYVAPDVRGRGIGQALLNEAISQAKRLSGLRQINLTVVTANEAARSLYKSCGFETFGLEREAFQIEGEYFDLEYMTLRFKKETQEVCKK